jgi:hypothetical protein
MLLAEQSASTFRLLRDSGGDYWIELHVRNEIQVVHIRGGNPIELCASRRLLCELLDGSDATNRPVGKVALIDQGAIETVSNTPRGRMALTFVGQTMKGKYVIDPVRLGRKTIRLLGKATSACHSREGGNPEFSRRQESLPDDAHRLASPAGKDSCGRTEVEKERSQ